MLTVIKSSLTKDCRVENGRGRGGIANRRVTIQSHQVLTLKSKRHLMAVQIKGTTYVFRPSSPYNIHSRAIEHQSRCRTLKTNFNRNKHIALNICNSRYPVWYGMFHLHSRPKADRCEENPAISRCYIQ